MQSFLLVYRFVVKSLSFTSGMKCSDSLVTCGLTWRNKRHQRWQLNVSWLEGPEGSEVILKQPDR